MNYHKLDNIQALRGIAALIVLLAHLGGLGGLYPFLPKFPAGWGVFGVDVFFVISGFIMFYVTRSTWGQGARFMLSRAARIYPLWWVCLLLEAPWMLGYLSGKTDEYFAYAAKSFFLFPALSPSFKLYPPLVPGWTLIYEVFFYFVFAATMLTPRRFVSLKILAVFLCALAVGSVLPEKSALKLFFSNPIYLEFLFGIASAELFLAGRLSKRIAVGAALTGVLSVLIISLGPKLTPVQFESFRFVWFGIPATCVVLVALWLEVEGFQAGRWLTRLGDASYSIYLTHELPLASIPAALAAYGLTGNGTLAIVMIGCSAVACGLATHYVVERPIHRWTTFLLNWWRPVRHAPPPVQ
ncbi:acyltransferase family protein [Cupriavidus campinensis]|jgi:exopolysaccharide production protein ExoZ|nr:acyltransferase [Cupriavidus campinensis]